MDGQMGHKNAKIFFEVYSKWIDGAPNQLEKDKMRRLVAQHRSEGPIRPSEPESE
ncbi:hypothetical protein D3C85_1915570 [compost metagenome]